MKSLYFNIRYLWLRIYHRWFTRKKAPWEMPTPPPVIAKIIDKVDAKIKLEEWEHQALADWEDEQGGFAGFM